MALSGLACTFGYHRSSEGANWVLYGRSKPRPCRFRDQGGTNMTTLNLRPQFRRRSSYKDQAVYQWQTRAKPQPCKGKASAPARSENLSPGADLVGFTMPASTQPGRDPVPVNKVECNITGLGFSKIRSPNIHVVLVVHIYMHTTHTHKTNKNR